MIPYLLAVAGGYLIGNAFKDDVTYAEGGVMASREQNLDNARRDRDDATKNKELVSNFYKMSYDNGKKRLIIFPSPDSKISFSDYKEKVKEYISERNKAIDGIDAELDRDRFENILDKYSRIDYMFPKFSGSGYIYYAIKSKYKGTFLTLRQAEDIAKDITKDLSITTLVAPTPVVPFNINNENQIDKVYYGVYLNDHVLTQDEARSIGIRYFSDGGMMAKGGMTKEELNDEIDNMKSMMESCYTYGGAEKGSYNYERYILPSKEKLGKELFDRTYNEKMKELKQYKVVSGVFTDAEGVTYNTLEKK